jgi:hypothetical protein
VRENTSILPEVEVPVGAVPPAHLIVAPEPLIVKVVGM